MKQHLLFLLFVAFTASHAVADEAAIAPVVECVWSDESWATFRITNKSDKDLFVPTMFFYETVIPEPGSVPPSPERWASSAPAFWTRVTESIADLVPLPHASSLAFTVRRQPSKWRIRLYFATRWTRDDKEFTPLLSNSIPERAPITK